MELSPLKGERQADTLLLLLLLLLLMLLLLLLLMLLLLLLHLHLASFLTNLLFLSHSLHLHKVDDEMQVVLCNGSDEKGCR